MQLVADLSAFPWCGWLFVYAFVLFCFSTSRCLALNELVVMYSSPTDYTSSAKVAALGLGFLEDVVCTTYFVCVLSFFDRLKHKTVKGFETELCGNIATFVVSWLLFVVMMIPFVADLLLVVNRDMRFTFDLVTMAINEREFASAAPISAEEIHRGYVGGTVLTTFATVFAIVRTRAKWSDLSTWNPFEPSKMASMRTKYVEVALEEGSEDTNTENSSNCQKPIYKTSIRVAVAFIGLVVFPVAVVVLSRACSPLVAYSGLNATLNEMFGHALEPASTTSSLITVEGSQPWVEECIHSTEKHELFSNDSLYRRTTGFQGELAFDVNVTSGDPNVLVIGVESFRFQDSRYLVGKDDPSKLFKGTNMTITPNFDKWAKRGVALRNLWSSSPTSRSLESLLFAQVPYDSTVKTGITGGRKNTKLSGLPQLFKAKGYETFFTTGCPTRFENWDVFLPSHGYDTLWDSEDMKKMAQRLKVV